MNRRGRVPICSSVFCSDHLRPAAKAAGVSIPDGHRCAGGKRFMKRAIENLPLIELRLNGSLCKVTALSPSHEAVTRMVRNLADANVVTVGKPRHSFRGDPNESSVALWIESLDNVVLLGADLLKGPSGCGWAGILSEFTPNERASLFKVPHHGAPNADEEMVWQKLLVPDDPVALLAPYRAGRHPRPDPSDRERICRRTTQIGRASCRERV